MSIIPITKTLLPNNGPFMGLDIGKNTIGVALSDDKATVATAYETIRRTKLKDDITKLQTIINTYNVQGLIIGIPLNLDGTKGAIYQKVMSFIHHLKEQIDLPITGFDERMSSKATKNILNQTHLKSHEHKKHIDAGAAAFILQNGMDSLHKNSHT